MHRRIIFFIGIFHDRPDCSQFINRAPGHLHLPIPFRFLSLFLRKHVRGCHSEIYQPVAKGSMHSLSQKDPVYLSVSKYIRKGLMDRNEIAEAESCVKCHVPVGVVTGYPQKTSDDENEDSGNCKSGDSMRLLPFRHPCRKNVQQRNLKLSPGNGEEDPGVKRGPLKDSESDFHQTAFSEFHTGSEICGTCHNV